MTAKSSKRISFSEQLQNHFVPKQFLNELVMANCKFMLQCDGKRGIQKISFFHVEI